MAIFVKKTLPLEKMFSSSTPSFDNLLDKATSHLLTEPDWSAITQLCDLICKRDVLPHHALHATKKKLMFLQNQHSALYALLVIENMVKNCGYQFREEVAIHEFYNTLCELAKTTSHENVRQKAIELIQTWKFAIRKSLNHGAPNYTITLLSLFDAMFSTDSLPEWLDSDVCHRCRNIFGKLLRKFHCRACGRVFCSQCTQKTTTLSKYEKKVRVCDACYDQVTKQNTEIKAPNYNTWEDCTYFTF